jgi:alkanesulfonate monooxygenase SsuD/methylene tetrahydromethanopterin reductase-like flavin-dependent oxidoreductase (luciferase family)
VKLDLLYEIQPKIGPAYQSFPDGQRRAQQETYREAIEQIQFADKLGFNTVWCVEHHFRVGLSACPTPEALLGGLALTTQNIRLGFGVVLMPFGFINPARVAEKVAVVDILSNGRVEWGTGRSTPMEQAAFGVPSDARSRDQWREAVDIVVQMWENERFSYDSPNYHLPERIQMPKPVQYPHPSPWLAASTAPSVENAGRNGVGLLSFSLVRPLPEMEEHIRLYREAQRTCEQPLTRVKNDRVGAYTIVHCCDDLDKAATEYQVWDSVAYHYHHLASFTLEWEFPNLSREEQLQIFPLLEARGFTREDVPVKEYMEEDIIIVGTPEMCLEKMLRYEAAGVDHLLCYVQFGALPHEKVMRGIELLGTRVIPKLEARGHRVDTTTVVA